MPNCLVRVSIATLIIMVFLFGSANASLEWRTSATLTVEETVALARLSEMYHFLPVRERADLEKKANAEARSELYRILDDPAQMKDWEEVASFFAIVGQAEDVPKLVERIRRFKGPLNTLDEKFVYKAIMNSFATMGDRGVIEATEALDKMMELAYWKDFSFTLYKGSSSPYYSDFPLFMATEAMYAKSWSTDPEFEKKTAVALKAIPDQRRREIFQAKRNGALGNYRMYAEGVRSGNPGGHIEHYFRDQMRPSHLLKKEAGFSARFFLMLMVPLIASLAATLLIRRGNFGLLLGWLISFPIIPAIVVYNVFFVPGNTNPLWIIAVFYGGFCGAISGAVGVGIAVAIQEVIALRNRMKR